MLKSKQKLSRKDNFLRVLIKSWLKLEEELTE